MIIFKKCFPRFLLLLFLILLFTSKSYSKTLVLTDDQDQFSPGLYLETLEDKDKNFSFDQVKNQKMDWKESEKESPGFGYTLSAYWIRFTVENRSEKHTWCMEISYAMLDKIFLYEPDKTGNYVEKKTGDHYEFSTREVKYRNFVFPLEIPKGAKKTYYMRFETEGSMNIPLTIWKSETFRNRTFNEQIILGLYYGGMLVMLVYNLFLFLGMKYRSYFYYLLFIASYILLQMTFNGLGFQYLWPRSIWWANTCMPFFIFLSVFWLQLFNRTFLSTYRVTPVYDKIILGILGVCGIGAALTFFLSYTVMIRIATFIIVPTVIIMISNSIICLVRGYRPARIYIIAWTIFFLGAAVYALKSFGLLPNNFITNSSIQIGSVMVVIGLSLSLVDQIYVLRKEKTDALNKLNEAYSRFVPHEFLELLEKESVIDIKLGDQVEKEITVLFADIRSFTTLSESMTPEENFNFLNSYLKRISPIIREHKGFIDKYIGDAIMAIFPVNTEDSLRAAIKIQQEMLIYNEHRNNCGYKPISIGIGLHGGKVRLGTVGEHKRIDGTVIADAVNLAARLEGLTKKFGAPILLSEELFLEKLNREQYNYRHLGKVKVKGKNKVISIIELIDGCTGDELEKKLATREDFEAAMDYFYAKNYPEAIKLFRRVLKVNPSDRAADIYFKRAEQYIGGIVTVAPGEVQTAGQI